MVGREEGDALAARISALPADELLEMWGSLTAVVARRVLEKPHSLTSRPEGGDTVDGRLDALIATRRELEHTAQVAQRVSRRADAVLHLVTGAHHASVRAYDQLSAEQFADLGAYPVEAGEGEYAAASMGATLVLSTPVARAMAETARSLRHRFPGLLDAAIAGDGVMRVAGMLADELDHLDGDASSRAEAALVAGGVHRRSHQAARERCRAILRQMGLARPVDPIAADRELGVWVEPHLDFEARG